MKILAPVAAAVVALCLSCPAAAQDSVSEANENFPVQTAPEALVPPAPRAAARPSVTTSWDELSGTLDHALARNVRLNYGGELTLQAAQVQGSLLHQQYTASGGIRLHDADTTLTANDLVLDGVHQVGVAHTALATQKPFRVRATQIDLGAHSVVAHQADVTTAPANKKPDFEVRAQTLSLFPDRRHGEARNASLFLFHNHILTVPKIGFTLGAGASPVQQGGFLPGIGVSSRYGTYLAFAGGGAFPGHLPFRYRLLFSTRQQTQVRVTSQQTLYRQTLPLPSEGESAVPLQPDYLGAIRKLAALRKPPLPPGDPLLFHDFLPDRNPIQILNGPAVAALTVNEEVSTHVPASGRRVDDLYVSRLPQVTLSGTLPLGPAPKPVVTSDPVAVRQRLRQVRFIGYARASLGAFREERPSQDPHTVHETRQRDVVGLTTQPLLIGDNTAVLPQLQLTGNFYSGQQRVYKYAQASFAINHYFSPRNGIGIQYLQSVQSGDSPFDFDHLDTSRELDVRGQIGSFRRTVAALIRYDLARGGVIDYKIAIANGLQGITPIFSYNFRSRSIGLAVAIEGVSF